MFLLNELKRRNVFRMGATIVSILAIGFIPALIDESATKRFYLLLRQRYVKLYGGQLLGKNVVAEGVATEKQAKALLKHGCVLAQGYFFSRPLSANDFEVFLSQRATRKLA